MEHSPEKIRLELPRVLPQRSQAGCAKLTLASCDDTWEMSSRKAHQRLNAQGIYQGLFTQAPSAWNISKLQIFQRKTAVEHKPCYLNKQSMNSQTFLSGSGGNPHAIQVPRLQPRATLQVRVCIDSRFRLAQVVLTLASIVSGYANSYLHQKALFS